jgi:hypothetical protein
MSARELVHRPAVSDSGGSRDDGQSVAGSPAVPWAALYLVVAFAGIAIVARV